MFTIKGNLTKFASENLETIIAGFKDYCNKWNIDFDKLSKHVSYIEEHISALIPQHPEAYINVYFDNVDYYCGLLF